MTVLSKCIWGATCKSCLEALCTFIRFSSGDSCVRSRDNVHGEALLILDSSDGIESCPAPLQPLIDYGRIQHIVDEELDERAWTDYVELFLAGGGFLFTIIGVYCGWNRYLSGFINRVINGLERLTALLVTVDHWLRQENRNGDEEQGSENESLINNSDDLRSEQEDVHGNASQNHQEHESSSNQRESLCSTPQQLHLMNFAAGHTIQYEGEFAPNLVSTPREIVQQMNDSDSSSASSHDATVATLIHLDNTLVQQNSVSNSPTQAAMVNSQSANELQEPSTTQQDDSLTPGNSGSANTAPSMPPPVPPRQSIEFAIQNRPKRNLQKPDFYQA